MSHSIIVGVDIGGSHITAALVDIESRRVLDGTWKRKPVNSGDSVPNIIAVWSSVIEECCKACGAVPDGIGIAMPGPFDYTEGISLMKDQSKYDTLYGLNIKQLLADALKLEPQSIRFANDAACFLQGEVFGGVAKDYDPVIGLTLGTGLGSARSFGQLAEDADLWCSSFKDGIAEEYLSTRWFVNRYRELTGNEVNGVKELSLQFNDPVIQQLFHEFGSNLGMFLAPLAAENNYQLLVLGGNIANSFSLFSGSLHQTLADEGCEIEIKISALGEHAALLGAASFACRETILNGS